MVSRRVRGGRWTKVHPDVYSLGSHSLSHEGRVLAAAWSLSGGRAAAPTAAWLLKIAGAKKGRVEIVVERGHSQPRPFVVHETRSLPQSHRATVGIVPCLTVSRTLVDLVSSWPREQLEEAWQVAILEKRTSIGLLDAVASHLLGRGHTGSSVLRELLVAHDDGDPVPESTLERILRGLLVGWGYPFVAQPPMTMLGIGGRGRADFYLPEIDLVLEGDGRRWHARVADFERDRQRDNLLQALGHHVARITYNQLVLAPDDVHDLIDSHYARCGYVRRPDGLWIPAAA